MTSSGSGESALVDNNGRSNTEQVVAYHQLSKHHLHRYADSLGYLDWSAQPDPFRTFKGAPTVTLPLLADALMTPFADLYQPGTISPRVPDINSIAILLELALGLSAWKEYQGSRWALRCNPSSGNLHPTEGYAILPSLSGIDPGVYHYDSRDHVLECRRSLQPDEAGDLARALPPRSFLVGLSSIHWREAWKYGVRAFRYCQHDIGHALASIRYAAAALGWSVKLLDDASDDAISSWLGLDSASFSGVDPLDREHPGPLLVIGSPSAAALPPLSSSGAGDWLGMANRLSPSHVFWEEIQSVARATAKPMTPPAPPIRPALLPPLASSTRLSAATLIRQRRSCLALDGISCLSLAAFYDILDHLLPRPEIPPWDMLPWQPLIHPAVIVHRVEGLVPGLYFLERSDVCHKALVEACATPFRWTRPDECPHHLRFFLLEQGDYRDAARTVSCHQDIAADGAFTLGMIASFGNTIRQRGPWWYRRLFWEAGVLGQVLYLQAEATGLRGTGIGCYFDDSFHRLLQLKGDDWQDLYHFTVGTPIEDPRLRTIAPYAHLAGR